jgi:Rrf2 family protein
MLSQRCKYALRALLLLAEQPKGTVMQIGEIAQRQNVPRKFLEAILLDLRRHGILFALRGRGGGYGFIKDPAQVTFGQVVRIMDGPLAPMPCASITGYRRCEDCDDERSCAIRRVMRRVRDVTATVLDQTTIADAVGGELEERLRSVGGRSLLDA